jgi:DNA-damage-inducible protein J
LKVGGECGAIVIRNAGGGAHGKEATFQVRMDADLKAQVEELYKRLGTSFAETVRMFARQSAQENGMPFMLHILEQKNPQRIGVVKGKLIVPEDMEKYNEDVLELFGDL